MKELMLSHIVEEDEVSCSDEVTSTTSGHYSTGVTGICHRS